MLPLRKGIVTEECHAGQIAREMLSNPAQVPTPATEVIQQLEGQQAELGGLDTAADLAIVTGHFESPFAEWLPEKSKQCEFHVLKPPIGVVSPSNCHGSRYRSLVFVLTFVCSAVTGAVACSKLCGACRALVVIASVSAIWIAYVSPQCSSPYIVRTTQSRSTAISAEGLSLIHISEPTRPY